MKKSLVFIIHASFWVSYTLLLFVIVAAVTQGFTTGPQLGYIIKVGVPFVVIPSVSAFYLFYFNLFPKYIKTKRLGRAFVYGVLFSLTSAIFGGLVLSLLFGSKMMFFDGLVSFLSEIFTMSLIAFLVGVVGIIIKGFISWYNEIKLKEELNIKNHQMELALLKSQLDPHFLFNTINNIDILILKDAQLASEYLNKLSDILRFMLFETKTDEIALSKEIEYIEKYIALQKIRTSNVNYINFQITGEISNQTISPMLLIPFIENAFKHVSNKKMENAITISLSIFDKKIEFVCENKYVENSKPILDYNGLGNDLIRKRIELMYHKKHNLAITNQNNIYRVYLELFYD